MAIETVGIISKPRRQNLAEIIPGLVEWLRARGMHAIFDRETAASLSQELIQQLAVPMKPRSELGAKCDLVLVLGGDGALLAAARAVRLSGVPLLAINLGNLGFLTAVTMSELYVSLDQILHNEHQIEQRKMLEIKVVRGASVVATYYALNDAVMNKGAISRILDFETRVDGKFLNLFKADGLIISTPTGSTAYCMAAGGPIVHPSVDAFIITPICSHTLSNRPLVVSDKSIVDVIVRTEAESVFLTVDGQVGLALHAQDRVQCSLSSSHIQLVRPPNKDFYEVLRSKLKWGER